MGDVGLVGTLGPLGVLVPVAGVGARELDDMLSFLEVERCLKCNEGLFVRLFYYLHKFGKVIIM